MITEDKVTELFCLADDFIKFFDNFVVNMLGAIAAYCLFPKKPCINVVKTIDTQLSIF